ncbi:hypothetical protein B4Q04_21985 [Zobellia sp. OII3]|nr:hypothetical protein B4Q04_21985 [Zobellia sp. OII3]
MEVIFGAINNINKSNMKKPLDFSPTLIDTDKEKIVSLKKKPETFYIVNDNDFNESKANDIIKCLVLESVEIKDKIQYFKSNPIEIISIESKELQSVLFTL